MKKLYFAVLCLSVFSVAAARADGLTKYERYEFVGAQENRTLDVRYFAHNSPNVSEFLEGKERVTSVLARISQAGFVPNFLFIEIGISPERMNGGDIVFEGGKLYVSLSASTRMIERRVISWFTMKASDRDVVFFPHEQPSIATFLAGKTQIESVLNSFGQRGMKLNLPRNLYIGVTEESMRGGNLVVEGGKIYIANVATRNQLERYFMKYAQF